MGKSITEVRNKDKDGETKVLFKKSNATLFTHSRTCSGASQLYSRSGILQIKKNLGNNHRYYTDRGKVKRDLSIETDVCVLRRYYRIKKNKMSYQGSSAKSRYSTLVDTEVETIEEFPDTSACGDNDTTENKSNPPLDIASLMIDNLKELLNQWIQKHLIENTDTKHKIDTVLDSLIEKLDTKKTLASSSGSTYVLHKEATTQEVKNKKVATASITCQYCKQKARNVKVGSTSNIIQKDSSSVNLPLHFKDIRIISTLSIPRSFHKRGIEEKKNQHNSWYKMKKIKHKNIILSIDRSNKVLDSSSFDLVAISTKSLTQRCTKHDTHVNKKKRHIVFFPKPFYKSATDTSSTTNNENTKTNNIEINKNQLDEMPSILKSLYSNNPGVVTSTDKNIQYDTKNDNYTMTESKEMKQNKSIITTNILKAICGNESNEKYLHEKDHNDPVVAIDFIEQSIEFPNTKKSKTVNFTKLGKTKMVNNYKKTSTKGKINKRKKHFINKLSPNFKATKFQSIHNKQFTFLYKKANSQMSQGKDFLRHCQNILQYFADYDGNKNIKLDVRINVFPIYENRTKDVCTDISNQALGVYDIKGGPTLLYNVQPTEIETPIQIEEESLKDPIENDNSSCEFNPEIIPLLDGAASQAKYIFNVNSAEKTEVNSKPNSSIERSTLTSELEIVQEISELRAVIKDLAAAAEKFVSEHLKKESNKSNAETNISRKASNDFSSSSKCEAVINLRNQSKAIQYSKDFAQNQKPQSGLKITKEPKKKDNFDYYNRLAKKSTSYRIIDSESILRVTDMTSKANEFNEYRTTDEALTCLPKSKSLFEMTSDHKNKQKLIALFCDGYQQHPQCNICDLCRAVPCEKKWFPWGKNTKKNLATSPKEPACICRSGSRSGDSVTIPINPDANNYGYSSTICFPPEEDVDEEQEQTTIEELRKCCKQRRVGMGFGEGCVYCMLLWIPVVIIACLFYGYVLRDKLKFPDSKKAVGRQGDEMRSLNRRNTSVLYLKLSDLGF